MVDAYKASDVGPVMVDGERVERSLAERKATAARWNVNKTARDTKREADSANERRLTVLSALVFNRSATPADMLEYLSLRDGLKAT